jgi:hypothetical protein
MVAALTCFMHIDEQILIVDGDLDKIADVEFWQSLIPSHVHRDIPRLSLTHSDFGLVASDVHDRAEKNPISGKEVRVGLLRTGRRITDGYAREAPHCEHNE